MTQVADANDVDTNNRVVGAWPGSDNGDTQIEPTEMVTRADQLGLNLGPLIEQIPDGGNDEFLFLRQIFQATTAAELDSAWAELDATEGWLDTMVRIETVKKLPSQFSKGIGWYFVLDLTVIETGEKKVVSTSSTNVMAQIIKAWALGAIPLTCVLRKSKKPSANGYYPQHLEIVPAAFASGS